MKKLHIAMAIAASVSTAAIAQAQDYQIEGGLSYTSTTIDQPGDDRSPTTIGLDGTYFIESVSTSGTVLNEAAFVGRNNNINAKYSTQDVDASGADDAGSTDIGVEWWFEDIYAALNINSTDTVSQATAGKAVGVDQNTLRVGYMVQENTRVNLVHQSGDQKEDGMGLEVKYIGAAGDNTINLEASMIKTDEDTATMFGGDYYFSDELSAGVSMSDTGADKSKSSTTLSVKNFFTPVISAELDYTTNPGGADGDSAMTLRGAMRF